MIKNVNPIYRSSDLSISLMRKRLTPERLDAWYRNQTLDLFSDNYVKPGTMRSFYDAQQSIFRCQYYSGDKWYEVSTIS